MARRIQTRWTTTDVTGPPPSLRVTTERRRRPFIAGLVCAVGGLVITLAGAVVTWSTQALEVATAEGRAQVGNPIEFDAQDRTYGLILITDLTFAGGDREPVQALDCSVLQPDGSVDEVDTGSQAVRVESDTGTEIGSFHGQDGATTVTCSWSDGRNPIGYFYSVAPTHERAELVANILLIAVVLIMGVGVVLLIIGIRGRSVTTRTAS